MAYIGTYPTESYFDADLDIKVVETEYDASNKMQIQFFLYQKQKLKAIQSQILHFTEYLTIVYQMIKLRRMRYVQRHSWRRLRRLNAKLWSFLHQFLYTQNQNTQAFKWKKMDIN